MAILDDSYREQFDLYQKTAAGYIPLDDVKYSEMHIITKDQVPELDYYLRVYTDGRIEMSGISVIDNVTFNLQAWGGIVTPYIDIFGDNGYSLVSFTEVPHCSIQYLGADAGYVGDAMIINGATANNNMDQLLKKPPAFKLWRGSSTVSNIYGHPRFSFFVTGRGKYIGTT